MIENNINKNETQDEMEKNLATRYEWQKRMQKWNELNPPLSIRVRIKWILIPFIIYMCDQKYMHAEEKVTH